MSKNHDDKNQKILRGFAEKSRKDGMSDEESEFVLEELRAMRERANGKNADDLPAFSKEDRKNIKNELLGRAIKESTDFAALHSEKAEVLIDSERLESSFGKDARKLPEVQNYIENGGGFENEKSIAGRVREMREGFYIRARRLVSDGQLDKAMRVNNIQNSKDQSKDRGGWGR